jgi:DNA polymerase
MSLELDDRQRAMLQEMGVRVWLPQAQVTQERIEANPPPAVAQRIVPTADVVALPPSRVEPLVVQASTKSVEADRSNGGPFASFVGDALALKGLDGAALRAAAASCEACGLCGGRKYTTLHLTDPAVQADWLVLGDPPDEDEDRLGQPFAEQAGLLLDNMLKAVGASRTGQGRQGAYLSNVVKCRPPAGRLPQAADLAQCAQYLQREMALVRPKLILALGRFAVQLMLEESPMDAALPLDKQRGKVYRYRGVPVIVSYHPKVLLRASANKSKAWADLCLAMDTLEAQTDSLQ